MKQNTNCVSRHLLLPLSIWLWCGGHNLIAQEAAGKPAPSITCTVENGTRSDADTYAVSNVEDIRLTVNLSNPQGLRLRLPSTFARNEVDSNGKNRGPTLSVVIKRLSGANREDVETKVGGRGISRRYNDTKVFLSLEIPITASERMKGISEYVKTLFTKPEEAESRKLGRELTVAALLFSGNSGFVVGERGFGPATALDTVDAPILKPSAFGRGWDLGACVNGGVEGRAGDAPLPPKWLITMGLRQKNRFNECKACGCEPASNHMSGFGFSATDSDSGRRAHGSHERARSARKGRKKHVSVLPRPNRSPWIVVEQNHNGIGKLMVPAFQIYANMNVINDL